MYSGAARPHGDSPCRFREVFHTRTRGQRQLAAGRSMRSTVYTGNVASSCFSSRPSLPRTVKIVGKAGADVSRLPGGCVEGAAFGGGGGNRIAAQPSVFTAN